jgi:tetratricopeptide (TPR) repeat protein
MTLKTTYKNLCRLVCYLAIFFLPSYAYSTSPSLLFQQGNEHYAKGDFKAAISNYQQLIKDGHPSATVYYNLGNAFFKTNEIASAILYYEKANKLAPGDEDVNYNLQMANLKTKDKLEIEPAFFLLTWWRSFLLVFSIQTLSFLSILFFSGGFLVGILYLYTQSSQIKRLSFYSAIGSVFVGILLYFMSRSQSQFLNSKDAAIVFSDVISLKSEPSASSKSLFVLHEGTKVQLKASSTSGWVKVALSNGNAGWIRSSDLKVI